MKKNHQVLLLLALTIIILLYRIWYTGSSINFNISNPNLRRHDYFINDYVIEPTTICTNKSTIVIIVTSYVAHVELRSAHRRAMPTDLLQSLNAVRVFLLALIPENEKYITQVAISDESNIFGDILQGNFLEHYTNLTHKHLMGLQWAARSCNSTFILKVDDDTVFSIEKTYELLSSFNEIDRQNFLIGYMLNETIPRRNKQNKWYVTWKEFPRLEYPSYLSGWYYVTTPEVASRICKEAYLHPYFWIDDVFVTGILTESLGLKLGHLPIMYWLEYYELVECCLRDMIKKFITCDVIGPNGGRNNLLFEYNEAARNCDKRRNCTTRPSDKSLNKTCVSFRHRDIFSDGKAEIQVIHNMLSHDKLT